MDKFRSMRTSSGVHSPIEQKVFPPDFDISISYKFTVSITLQHKNFKIVSGALLPCQTVIVSKSENLKSKKSGISFMTIFDGKLASIFVLIL